MICFVLSVQMVDIYVEYMSTVAKLLGTKCNTTAKMREIMDFEKKLAKVGVLTSALRTKRKQRWTLLEKEKPLYRSLLPLHQVDKRARFRVSSG